MLKERGMFAKSYMAPDANKARMAALRFILSCIFRTGKIGSITMTVSMIQ